MDRPGAERRKRSRRGNHRLGAHIHCRGRYQGIRKDHIRERSAAAVCCRCCCLLRIRSKPVVMAIHGTALGGGLEIAMAGHYRVAVPSAQVGQPEVKLGIIPGAAGTQRLPRLAGVAKALQMCAAGEPISAAQALECGLIDKIIEGDLLNGAVEFAASQTDTPKTRERNDKLESDASLFEAARESIRKRQRGLMAPLAAINAVEAATKLSFEDGCAVEAELFQRCLFSDQSKGLIHAFFGERAVSKIPDIPKSTPLIPIRSAAVIGAGTMGGGIVMNYANAGIPVLLKETTQAALDGGLATIRKNYENSVKKGRFSQEVMDQRLSLIIPHPELRRLRGGGHHRGSGV